MDEEYLNKCKQILEGNTYTDPCFCKGVSLPLPLVQNVAYQLDDADAGFDYRVGELQSTGLYLRNLIGGFNFEQDYIVAIGAAQTFGRGVEQPYCELVASAVGKPCINLGVGGIGPRFYLIQPAIVDVINGASLCLANIMSSRSTTLPGCIPTGSCVYRTQEGWMFWSTYVETLVENGISRDSIIQSLQSAYIEDYRALRCAIKVPTLFVNFGGKGFPQNVTEEMLAILKALFNNNYVENVKDSNNNNLNGLSYYLSQEANFETAELVMKQLLMKHK